MAKEPFYKIVVKDSGRDITSLVTSFKYIKDSEKDDLLRLTLQDIDLDIVDDTDLLVDKILIFRYGYKGGSLSKKRYVKIKSSIPTFGRSIKLHIQCLDSGSDIKGTTSKKIWKDKTSSTIAKEIADKLKFETKIEETKKVWEDMPQGNRNEFEFLQYLAEREDGGDYIFFMSGNTLNFIKRKLTKAPIVTYHYGGSNNVLSFSPKFKDAEVDGSADAVSITSVDEDGKIDNNVIDSTNSGEVNLGETTTFDGNSIELDSDGGNIDTGVKGREVVVPILDNEEKDNLAKKINKEESLNSITGTLSIEGDPLLDVDELITLKGVGQRLSGNWYIKSITDDISMRGFITTIELAKNSTKTPIKANAKDAEGDINKQIGENEVTTNVEINTFDSNSNQI